MLRISLVALFLVVLSACNPFSAKQGENQFTKKNKQLSFMGHKLGYWSNKDVPQCTLCSYTIYSKKMIPGAMLFKQINNERGDLVFLAADNIRYSFGLQTGGRTYSIAIKIEGDKTKVTVGQQQPFYLTINQKQKVMLGVNSYFVKLQKIDHEGAAVNLSVWSKSIMPSNG